MSSKTLKILHFNDVYRASKQNVDGGTIDVSQWAQMLEDLRVQWADGCLVLFSGDVFSPSIESSVTRGSHMVPIMNAIGIDCAVAGNHDFDWSAAHFSNLVKDSNYPWLLSNIIDEKTGNVPEGLHDFQVIEKSGLRIGIVGLVEQDWIQTISSWPAHYKHRDMCQVALNLSQKLRDPSGPHKCDIVIALTHSRVPNDIALAKAIHCKIGPEAADKHGCDIILGGHDHFYYVSKYGPDATSWSGYDVNEPCLGAEGDEGVLIIKSGTDFRDLSEIELDLEESPEGSCRKYFIRTVHGTRHCTKPDMKPSEKVAGLLEKLVGHIQESLSKPVCKLDSVLDCRSEIVRIDEVRKHFIEYGDQYSLGLPSFTKSASGNWFADVIRHAYDDALCLRGVGGADAVFICGGTVRGDSKYGPGEFTVGDIMEILPFQDPIVVLQMDGSTIWTALESSLETWPAQEGRFPVVSGLRVQWDSRKPKRERVLSVDLVEESQGHDSHDESNDPAPERITPVSKEPGGRVYTIVTRLYMAQGSDGYEAFRGCNYVVDEENGRIMSDLVRHFLLGSQYINKMKDTTVEEAPDHLSPHTDTILAEEQNRYAEGMDLHGKARWAEIVRRKVFKPSRRQAMGSYHVAANEHMSSVDCVDGGKLRGGQERPENIEAEMKEYLVTVSPHIDGRLKDVGRAQDQ